MVALYAAGEAGIATDKEVVARDQVCRELPGQGWRLRLCGGVGAERVARTAAAVSVLAHFGLLRKPEAQKGLEYLAVAGEAKQNEAFLLYGTYYSAQANKAAGEETFEKWLAGAMAMLIERQARAGNWTGEGGEPYATAMALIVLQLPEGRLPVFKVKK